MTNRELIGRVRSTIKEHNADSVLYNKHIYNLLLTNSALLIKREADKKSIYMMSNIWKTVCVEMIPVNPIVCKCVKLPIDCTIYRSKEKLPPFFETNFGPLYKSITTIDNSINIDLTTPYQYNLKVKIKYNKAKYAFIEDGYLYTPNSSYPWLKIVGLFKEEGNNCDESKVVKCSKLDQEFPCPDYLLQPVIEMTLKELGYFKQINYDHVENKNTLS